MHPHPPAPAEGMMMDPTTTRNPQGRRRNHRRGPAPRPPRPADMSAEALIDTIGLLGALDAQDAAHAADRRRLRHSLLASVTEAINGQRMANGLPELSDVDRSALGFPSWAVGSTERAA